MADDTDPILEAINHIVQSIAAVAYENGPQRALAARALADLAEARAWVIAPDQPHGGRVTTEN